MRDGRGVELMIIKILVAVASLTLLALPLSFIGSVAATASGLNPHSPIHIRGNHNFPLASRVASALVMGKGYYNARSGVPPPHYEVVAHVTWVYDGDTIQVWVEDIVEELDPEGEVYEGNSECVRFGGGVDAPETWTTPPEEGSYEATEFIENLIPIGTTVYLDLNSLSRGGQTGRPYRGTYERLIAVIYAEIDGQWINANAELLRWGQEEYPAHDWLQYIYFPSEWDPYQWLEEDYPYVRDFVERRGVMISILPDENTGAPSENATFTVFIKSIGNVEDTYGLIAGDNTCWNLMLTDNLIEHIAPNNVQKTTLAVTIPENVENGAQDYITVTATSLEKENINNSASCTVTAIIPGHYCLTTNVDPPGSGSVTLDPAGGTYKEGTDVTTTANPTLGYKFDHWSGDASGTSTSVTVTMNSEKSITAHFRSTGEGGAKGELPWTWIGVGIVIIVVIIVAVVATMRGPRAAL